MLKRRRPLGRDASVENRLWARLRTLEGTRFRRKSPFKTFTLDFVEHERRLVIALLDGEPGKTQPVHIVRDRLLAEQGYVILRLWKTEVAHDLSGAVHTIRTVLQDLAAHDSL